MTVIPCIQSLAHLNVIRVFGRAFVCQWLTDNKPHGFDVQDHRIGAFLCRTDACRRRMLDYTSGKIDRIEELDEALLPYGNKEESARINRAPLYSTVNILHQNSVAL